MLKSLLIALASVVGVSAAGCSAWCNSYTCDMAACSDCADSMCHPAQQCHSWCNAYTCGMNWCSDCDVCDSQAQGHTHCSFWCNSWTCGSEPGFFQTQCGGCEECKPPVCTSSQHLRTVIHKFKSDADKDAWWAYFGNPVVLNAFIGQNVVDGTYMHYFMPSDDGETINCLWETKGCWSDDYFQKWIDGPTGPGYMGPDTLAPNPNVFINTPYLGTTAIAPANHFTDSGGIATPSTAVCTVPAGSLFFVKHTYQSNVAAVDWVNALATFSPPDYGVYNFGNGVSNPQFILLDTDTTAGSVAPDAMCVWETRDDMTKAQFQAYIDGPTGPGAVRGNTYGNTPYNVFVNEVFKVIPNAGIQPCSKF